jgi:hypothetical protein
MTATPSQRQMIASIATLTRWAKEPDRAEAMKPAHKGFLAKFEKQVDPNGELDPQTRTRLAEAARKAHMKRLALASSKSRAAKKASKTRGAA